MMNPIQNYAYKTLQLVQPKLFKQKFELKHEDNLIGSLELTSHFRHNAIMELFGTKWELKNLSIWKSKFGIFKFGYELPFATLTAKAFKDDLLELPSGVVLNFKYRLFKHITEVRDAYGDLIYTSAGKASFKENHTIEILRSSSILDENPWIIFIGAYLRILRHRQSAAG